MRCVARTGFRRYNSLWHPYFDNNVLSFIFALTNRRYEEVRLYGTATWIMPFLGRGALLRVPSTVL